MSKTPPSPVHQMPREHYLNATYGIRSWLLTTDHKRIALLYLASVTFFFFIGGLFATMIRIHLLTPSGYLVTPETYNKLFTMHGVAMIFFFLIPSIPAVLGNFLIPMMIGAKHLAVAGRSRAHVSPGLLQSGAGRRSHSFPASLLVLFAPRRLHHDSSGDGRDQRNHSHLRSQTHLRILFHRWIEYRHRGHRLPRMGASHVRDRRVHLRRAHLLLPQLRRGDSLGGQSLQLDLDAL